MKSGHLTLFVAKNITVIFTILMLVAIMSSCVKKKQSSSDTDQLDSLMKTYSALKDSVDHEWEIMINDDDDNHKLMKRLLLEVSYTNTYDKDRFKELNSMVDQLKSMRYDQNSMGNSALIDAYDSATFALSDQIIAYARDHPRYTDFPLMEELINDINGKNNYILMHRIHYDTWVKELNAFKNKHRKKILKADPGLEMESMPLFELSS